MMSANRRGFSLMEVMLATGVLLGSSVALIELANLGRRQASRAYDLNEAQLLCQAKLDEMVAEIEPVKAAEEQELEDHPGWMYSVEIEPTRMRRLSAVKVSVFQEEHDGNRPARFTLVRWLNTGEVDRATTPNSNPLLGTDRPQRERPREVRP